jgi:glutamate--cysteine ligase
VTTLRAEAWLHIDPLRTGFPRIDKIWKEFSKSSCVESYFEFAMNAPVVFIAGCQYEVPATKITFKQWVEVGYKGTFPTQEDFETHLSLLFPEVRPRGFLELRSVDCQSRVWQSVPAIFYLGLLYDAATRKRVLEMLRSQIDDLETWRNESIFGLRDATKKKLAIEIMANAREGFSRVPPCYRSECSVESYDKFFDNF